MKRKNISLNENNTNDATAANDPFMTQYVDKFNATVVKEYPRFICTDQTIFERVGSYYINDTENRPEIDVNELCDHFNSKVYKSFGRKPYFIARDHYIILHVLDMERITTENRQQIIKVLDEAQCVRSFFVEEDYDQIAFYGSVYTILDIIINIKNQNSINSEILSGVNNNTNIESPSTPNQTTALFQISDNNQICLPKHIRIGQKCVYEFDLVKRDEPVANGCKLRIVYVFRNNLPSLSYLWRKNVSQTLCRVLKVPNKTVFISKVDAKIIIDPNKLIEAYSSNDPDEFSQVIEPNPEQNEGDDTAIITVNRQTLLPIKAIYEIMSQAQQTSNNQSTTIHHDSNVTLTQQIQAFLDSKFKASTATEMSQTQQQNTTVLPIETLKNLADLEWQTPDFSIIADSLFQPQQNEDDISDPNENLAPHETLEVMETLGYLNSVQNNNK